MKTLKTTKNEIENILTISIDKVFYDLQLKNNISRGDISPMDSLKLENSINELSTLIYNILKYQL